MPHPTVFDIRWLGTACFEVRLADGKTIIIDPYLNDSLSAPIGSDEIEGCDFIFLTHGHYDHVLDVGPLVERFNARVFCSREVCQSLIQWQNINPGSFQPVTAGDRVEEKGFTTEVVPGVHVDFFAEYKRLTGNDLVLGPGEDLKTAVQKALQASLGSVLLPDRFETWMARYPGGEQLNFVFDLEGGDRIYMAGSYPDPSLIKVSEKTRASVMLLQVLPGKTLRGLEERTARFALASGAKIVVPQHHDPLFMGAEKADLREIERILSQHEVNLMEFTPGKWYRFGGKGERCSTHSKI
jgi:L-ascorbate metabolism protein UlaG (beta-lactamase superfamily)